MYDLIGAGSGDRMRIPMVKRRFDDHGGNAPDAHKNRSQDASSFFG
jgi:hypothetical protein